MHSDAHTSAPTRAHKCSHTHGRRPPEAPRGSPPTLCMSPVTRRNRLCAKMDFKDTNLLPLFYQNVGMPKNPFLDQEALGKQPHNILKSDVLCINCDRCLRACEDIQNIGVYGWLNDKDHNYTSVGVYAPNMFNECVQCGQCILHCPVGALYERSELTQL